VNASHRIDPNNATGEFDPDAANVLASARSLAPGGRRPIDQEHLDELNGAARQWHAEIIVTRLSLIKRSACSSLRSGIGERLANARPYSVPRIVAAHGGDLVLVAVVAR